MCFEVVIVNGRGMGVMVNTCLSVRGRGGATKVKHLDFSRIFTPLKLFMQVTFRPRDPKIRILQVIPVRMKLELSKLKKSEEKFKMSLKMTIE